MMEVLTWRVKGHDGDKIHAYEVDDQPHHDWVEHKHMYSISMYEYVESEIVVYYSIGFDKYMCDV